MQTQIDLDGHADPNVEPADGRDTKERSPKKIEWLSFWLPLFGVIVWLGITFLLFLYVLADMDGKP